MRMRIAKKFYLAAASLVVAAGAFVTLLNTDGSALTMGDRRDCGYTDVIINCGATSSAELLEKYDANNDGRGNRDIQAIFNHYGIQRSDITGATSDVKKGWLNTNGVISVDGKTVATNAKSLYRVDPGKQVSPVSISGKTYYIGPVANNYSLGADVFVFFKNNRFHAAIQSSCGNPIVATPEQPEPEPEFACNSLQASKLSRTKFRFNASATAKNGASIVSYTYNFGDGRSETSTSNTIEHEYAQAGNYTATLTVNFNVSGQSKSQTGANCKVTVKVEEEQKQPEYACESLKATKINRTTYQFTADATASNGATIESYTYNFGDSKSTTTTDTQVNHTYAEAGNYTATLTVNFKVDGQNKSETGTNCKVTIKVEEEQKEPVYACESLKATKINRTTYQFTADATASNGASTESYTYNFGDGRRSTTTQSTVTHEYEDAGNYTAKVTVNVRVNGQVVAVNDGKCKVLIEVDEEPVTPSYKCESLTAQLIQDRTYAYNLTYAADGGATLDRVTYNFGDDTSETLDVDAAASVEHTYAQPGNYTTTATLYFNVPENGEMVEKSKKCEVKVAIEEPEYCPIPGKEQLPVDSPECVEDEEMCPIPGKEHLPKDSTECVETPPELPKTGMEMFIGGGLGLGSISAAGYYWTASRRNLLNAFLNK